LPWYSRASTHAAGASGYFFRNSSLKCSSEHSIFVSLLVSIGFDDDVEAPQPASRATAAEPAIAQMMVFTESS